MLTISQKKFCADGNIGSRHLNLAHVHYLSNLALLHRSSLTELFGDLFSSLAGFESMLWRVPVTIATSKNPAALKFVLDTSSTTVTVEGVGSEDWILVSLSSTVIK